MRPRSLTGFIFKIIAKISFSYNYDNIKIMRYLGIDYGAKRVGLSLSDEEGKMAFPYKIISNNLELSDAIHNICGEEEVSAIVLGESHDLSGTPNKIMGSIEEFKRNLEGELDLPIYFEKEFMTSIFARGNIGKKENDARKSKFEKSKNSQIISCL